MIKKLKDDSTLRITSADKGKAVVIEDDTVYRRENMDTIEQSDCVPAGDDEKKLVDGVKRKLKEEAMRKCGLSDEEGSKYLVSAAEVALQYLLIKVHKPGKGCPGRQ